MTAALGSTVRVGLSVDVDVGDAVRDADAVSEPVLLLLAVWVALLLLLAVDEIVLLLDAVWLALAVAVRLRVAVTVALFDAVDDAVGLLEAVTDGVDVSADVPVPENDAVLLGDAELLGVCVELRVSDGVCVGLRVSLLVTLAVRDDVGDVEAVEAIVALALSLAVTLPDAVHEGVLVIDRVCR